MSRSCKRDVPCSEKVLLRPTDTNDVPFQALPDLDATWKKLLHAYLDASHNLQYYGRS